MADDNSREHDDPAVVERLPLIAEEARIEKRSLAGARVRVSIVNETRDEILRDELAGERISVERVSVGRTIEGGETAPILRIDGDVTIVPVLEEVLVVTKQLVLKEELRITRHATREAVEFPVTLRSQRAVIERTGPQGPIPQPMPGEEPQT